MINTINGRVRLQVWNSNRQRWRTAYVLLSKLDSVLERFRKAGIQTRALK